MQNTITATFQCISILLVSRTHCYVLLAGNLDDFKTLAKKLVPEKLAVQIAEIAAASAVKLREKQSYRGVQEKEDEEEAKVTGKALLMARNSKSSERTRQVISRLAFERLVQKVKERIERDLSSKTHKTRERVEHLKDYKHNNLPRKLRFNKQHRPNDNDAPRKPINKQDEDQNSDYEKGGVDEDEKRPRKKDEDDEQNAAGDEALTYARIAMTKKDSYEDYAMPEKEKDVYESAEPKTAPKTKAIEATLETVPLAKHRGGERWKEKENDAEEIKARTEDLSYDYKVEIVTEPFKRPAKETFKNLKKATVIPKRDYFKMSSPNYYGKIPVVAEKYDFDEPIPEKDRVPERETDYMGGLPLNINGKVKIQ